MSDHQFDLHAPWCPTCNDAMRPAVKQDYSKPPITHMLVWECLQPHKQKETQNKTQTDPKELAALKKLVLDMRTQIDDLQGALLRRLSVGQMETDLLIQTVEALETEIKRRRKTK